MVLCAIALSLAYPVREYAAQRSEIRALRKREAVAQREVKELTAQRARLGDQAYIKREARRRLHFCDPGEKCYIVLDGQDGASQYQPEAKAPKTPPWYETLWKSVEAADAQ